MIHPPQPTKDKTAETLAYDLACRFAHSRDEESEMKAAIQVGILAYSKQAVEAEREEIAKMHDEHDGPMFRVMAKRIRSRGRKP